MVAGQAAVKMKTVVQVVNVKVEELVLGQEEVNVNALYPNQLKSFQKVVFLWLLLVR